MSNLAVKNRLMTEEEFLAFEEKSKIRHEFMDGEVFAMAGATRKHNLANTNISRVLGNQLLETDCEVYVNDFRVRIRLGHNVYPDVAVACGDIQTVDKDKTLLNSIVVFEVLSNSTEKRDRNEKREDYFNLPSVKDYVLVSQNRIKVEHYSRQNDNTWLLKIYEEFNDIVKLDSVKCSISLRDVYLKIKISPLKLIKTNK